MPARTPGAICGISPEVHRGFGPYWHAKDEGRREVFRVTRDGARFALFCRAFLRHTKGRWAGKPVELEPWQMFLFSELLRAVDEPWVELTRRQVADPWDALRKGLERTTGEPLARVYSEGYVQLPKKNGKSTLASAFALYMLVADQEPGAEVYSAAAKRDQARIVFGEASKMVKASPLIDHVKVYRDAIEVPETGSTYRVLSADGATEEGLGPHAYVADELHRHPKRDLIDVLSKGMVARDRPVGLVITNAGADPNTICGEWYRNGRAVAEAAPNARDDLFFFCPELLDAQGKPDDRAVLRDSAVKRVNPASWITEKTIRGERRKSPPFVFARFNGNRWTRAETSWLPPGAWDACKGQVQIEDGDPEIVFVDLGVRSDCTGVIELAPKGRNEAGKPVYHVWGFCIRAHPDPSESPPPAHEVVEGDTVPHAAVEGYLRELADAQEVLQVGYDPWRFSRSAELLEDEGFPAELVEVPQSNERMCPASQRLFDMIVERRIVHDGDPILAQHIAAAAAKDTPRGWRLDKLKASEKMDLAMALAGAVYLAELADDETADPRLERVA